MDNFFCLILLNLYFYDRALSFDNNIKKNL